MVAEAQIQALRLIPQRFWVFPPLFWSSTHSAAGGERSPSGSVYRWNLVSYGEDLEARGTSHLESANGG